MTVDPSSVTIVATLGPASEDEASIRALADAGASVTRLNASHGSTADRERLVDRVRAVDADREDTLAVMLDLAGPEIRTAPAESSVTLADGAVVRLVEGETLTTETIGLSASLDGVSERDRILLDDGRIETVVTSVDGDGVTVRVESGGTLGGRKGVNVPGVDLGLDPVTEHDERDLDLAADRGVDFVAASFVRDADDVYRVSEAIENRGADVPVVAKIERADAVANVDGIVEAAHGVMVARGDLGVECPLEAVPLIQKRIVRRCRDAGVPVITATEMLDSMVREGRPTRAEATDVANAVLDGTDAVMLSAETAIGDHPVRVVETMDRIVRDAAESEEYAELREQRVPQAGDSGTDALARSARYLARDVDASAVVVASESGYTARKAAKYRPGIPVVAATPNHAVRRRLALHGGVVPRYVDLSSEGSEAIIHDAVGAALDAGVAASGETVVALAGMMSDIEGVDTTNTLKLHVAASVLAAGRSVVVGYATGPIFRPDGGDLSAAPDGAVLVLTEGFDAEFDATASEVAGIVDARSGVTSYAAIVARELGVPMVGEARLPDSVGTGDEVTVDGHRGVVYEGAVQRGHAAVSSGADRPPQE